MRASPSAFTELGETAGKIFERLCAKLTAADWQLCDEWRCRMHQMNRQDELIFAQRLMEH